MQSVAISIAVAVSVLLVTMVLRDIVELFPNLIGCLMRGKENINLYNNVRMRRARNRIFGALMPGFILILSCLYIHPFTEGQGEIMSFLITAGIIAAFAALRLLCELIFCGHSMRSADFRSASQIIFSFTIIAALLSFTIFGISRFFGAEDFTIQKIIQWEIVAVYALCVLREGQVFCSTRGNLSGILYLCALEVIPAGMLGASYIIF